MQSLMSHSVFSNPDPLTKIIEDFKRMYAPVLAGKTKTIEEQQAKHGGLAILMAIQKFQKEQALIVEVFGKSRQYYGGSRKCNISNPPDFKTLDDKNGISRMHFMLITDNKEKWICIDLGSFEGTYISGKGAHCIYDEPSAKPSEELFNEIANLASKNLKEPHSIHYSLNPDFGKLQEKTVEYIKTAMGKMEQANVVADRPYLLKKDQRCLKTDYETFGWTPLLPDSNYRIQMGLVQFELHTVAKKENEMAAVETDVLENKVNSYSLTL